MPSANINANFIGGGGGFLPSKVSGLTLWLDDPAGVFNGINNIIEDGSNNVSGWLSKDGDYLLGAEFATTWQNGSTGFDTFTAQGTDGFDAVKTTASGVDGAVVNANQNVTAGEVYRYSFDLTINSLSGGDGNINLDVQGDAVPAGGRSTIDTFTTSGAKSGSLIISTTDTTARTAFTCNNNVLANFEVRNFTIKKLSGNHFVQTTAVDQPNRSGSEITFDGATEFLDGSLNVSNFDSDTAGELILVVDPLSSLATSPFFFSMSDANTNNDRMLFGSDVTDWQLLHDPGAGNTVDFGANSTGVKIHSYTSNGSVYQHFLNGVNDPVTSGTDDGNWFDALGVGKDSLGLGGIIQSSQTFYNISLRSILYYNRLF